MSEPLFCTVEFKHSILTDLASTLRWRNFSLRLSVRSRVLSPLPSRTTVSSSRLESNVIVPSTGSCARRAKVMSQSMIRSPYGGVSPYNTPLPRQMLVSDFDYPLPPELIAQAPLPRRDQSRLLVLHRDGRREHRRFSDLPDYLQGETVYLNDSRVLRARIYLIRNTE